MISLCTKSNFLSFFWTFSEISGVDQIFRGRPNFPGPTKFSGADQIFRGRPNFPGSPPFFPGTDLGENCIFWGVETVEMHPIERAGGCPQKDGFERLLGWDRFLDENDIFVIFLDILSNFLDIFGKFGGRHRRRGRKQGVF